MSLCLSIAKNTKIIENITYETNIILKIFEEEYKESFQPIKKITQWSNLNICHSNSIKNISEDCHVQ